MGVPGIQSALHKLCNIAYLSVGSSNDLSNSKASSNVFNFTTSFINSVSAGLLFTYASNNPVASDSPFSCSNQGVTTALNRGSHSSILLFGFSTGITNCVILSVGLDPWHSWQPPQSFFDLILILM